MIAIYAEKFDVGIRIACALSNFKYEGKIVKVDDINKIKKQLERTYKTKGFIEINWEGKDTVVIWGRGHLLELKNAYDYNPDYKNWRNIPLPFFLDKYETRIVREYDYNARKQKETADPFAKNQLSRIKDIFNKAEYIINATDDDREGELIFSLIYEYVKSKTPYKRVTLTSQTEEGFKKAFSSLKDSKDVINKEKAGRARSVSDFIIGTNLTVATTLRNRHKGVLSIGRVQTAVLNMIVQRDLEIENFKSKTFFNLVSKLKSKNAEFETKLNERFETKEEVLAIIDKIKNEKAIISDIQNKISIKKPPLLYNLTELQKDANKMFGFTANETLDLAQELYENGYITYPRTSSRHLTEDMFEDVKDLIDNSIKEEYPMIKDVNKDKRFFDTNKVESHFAIIPTNKAFSVKEPKLKALYSLVKRSLALMSLGDAKIEETEAEITIGDYKFYVNGNIIKEKGFTQILNINSKVLPDIKKGDVLEHEEEVREGKTTPPKRLNTSSLLSMMVNAGSDDDELKEILSSRDGIGTEATRANIIETLIKRKYIQYDNKNIISTEIGRDLIKFFPVNDLKSPEITAKIEKRLNLIEDGKEDADDFIRDIKDYTEKWIKEINNMETFGNQEESQNNNLTKYKCPNCGGGIIEYSKGYFCENKDFYLNKEIAGKKITEKILKDLCEKRATGKISGFIKKDGTPFKKDPRLIVSEDGKIEFDFGIQKETSKHKCPNCGGEIIEYSKGYFCENRDFYLNKEIAGKKITEKMLKDLCEKRITEKISGFTKKDGTPFKKDPRLIVSEDGKIEFDFSD